MNRLTYVIAFATMLTSCVNGPSDLKRLEGQRLTDAISILGKENYRVTYPVNFEFNADDCGSVEMVGLVNLRDPSHYVSLEIDRDCNVTSASSHARNVP